jgi:hypothetical protein
MNPHFPPRFYYGGTVGHVYCVRMIFMRATSGSSAYYQVRLRGSTPRALYPRPPASPRNKTWSEMRVKIWIYYIWPIPMSEEKFLAYHNNIFEYEESFCRVCDCAGQWRHISLHRV